MFKAVTDILSLKKGDKLRRKISVGHLEGITVDEVYNHGILIIQDGYSVPYRYYIAAPEVLKFVEVDRIPKKIKCYINIYMRVETEKYYFGKETHETLDIAREIGSASSSSYTKYIDSIEVEKEVGDE